MGFVIIHNELRHMFFLYAVFFMARLTANSPCAITLFIDSKLRGASPLLAREGTEGVSLGGESGITVQ